MIMGHGVRCGTEEMKGYETGRGGQSSGMIEVLISSVAFGSSKRTFVKLVVKNVSKKTSFFGPLSPGPLPGQLFR